MLLASKPNANGLIARSWRRYAANAQVESVCQTGAQPFSSEPYWFPGRRALNHVSCFVHSTFDQEDHSDRIYGARPFSASSFQHLGQYVSLAETSRIRALVLGSRRGTTLSP